MTDDVEKPGTNIDGAVERRDLLVKARDEIAWFFGSAAGDCGFHAQGYEGGSEAVWDHSRINALHVKMLTTVRRGVQRRQRIGETIRRLSVEMIRDLAHVYAPFGWHRLGGASVDASDRANWEVFCIFSANGRQLLPLALQTPEMLVAYGRRNSTVVRPSFHQLLLFVQTEVAALKVENIRPGKALPTNHRLDPPLRAADRRETAAATAYDAFRRERFTKEERVKTERLDRELAQKKAREDEAIERRLARKRGEQS